MRAALVPQNVKKLVDNGLEVSVETGFGVAAGFTDDSYREAGASVIFVSHEMELVRRFCRRVIWLDQGVVRMDGPSDGVVDAMLAAATQRSIEEVPDDASINDYDAWNSMAHVRLVLAMEEFLRRELAPDAIVAIESLSDVANWLQD